MGSEKRQRTRFLGVRLYDEEYTYLSARAAELGCSMSELMRARALGRPPQPRRAPCSPNHPDCTVHHRDLVDGYRDQREREERAVEDLTGNHDGDRRLWKENGGRFTTFTDWLKGRSA